MTQQILDEANRAFQQGRLDEAERLLRSAVAAEPQSIVNHVALATMLSERGQHAAATESYAQAMRIDRNRRGVAAAYAVSCYRAGRFDEAEKSARFAVQVEPGPGPYDTLACALWEQGKLPDALAASEQALAMAPDNVVALNTKGRILLTMGRSAEALAIFEGLIKRGVVTPAMTLNQGAALEKLGRTADATRLYTEAAARWSNFADLQRERAQRHH